MSGPIPDDHSHHVTYETQFLDIFWGALIGLILHHCDVKFNVEHPASD